MTSRWLEETCFFVLFCFCRCTDSKLFSCHWVPFLLSWFDARQNGTPINSCNQTRINSPGFLSSPGYPRAYAGHTNCFYHLKAPSDNKIKLEFLVFDIQSNTHCRYNYLQIFDGPDMSYPHSEKHCGNQDLGFYYSTAPEILIRFVSTSSYYSGAGFHVRFSFHTSFTTDHSNQSGSDDIIEPMDGKLKNQSS
ncbi:NRP2 [Acanthosepion pharaonis]|uniref:NRP2 n=1 Tax=Acanthosepion pharaonis TaxID=158019 RepID=A0A812E8B1_ACAPH|nr:NRP2 [Sepia pharaonis]